MSTILRISFWIQPIRAREKLHSDRFCRRLTCKQIIFLLNMTHIDIFNYNLILLTSMFVSLTIHCYIGLSNMVSDTNESLYLRTMTLHNSSAQNTESYAFSEERRIIYLILHRERIGRIKNILGPVFLVWLWVSNFIYS